MKRLKYCIALTLSALLAAASALPAAAALPRMDRSFGDKPFVVDTPRTNQFSVPGSDKTFILLDTVRKDGKPAYYVLAKETYGNGVFDTDGTQMFDPADKSNIAYFLNHDFLEKGNGDGLILPKEIVEHIDKNHEWVTEPGHPDSNCPEEYAVTAGVGLMSQTEWNRYAGKFGVKDEIQGEGWMLRTGRAVNGKPNLILACRTVDSMIGQTHEWPATTKIAIRPAFYLDKSFFTSVKLDPATLGSTVKRAILDTCSLEELKNAGYSASELERISNPQVEIEEQINLEVLGKDEFGVVAPGTASFTLSFYVNAKKAVRYTVEYESGGELYSERVSIPPREKVTKQFSVPGLEKGVTKLHVTVRDSDRVAAQFSEPVPVFEDYTPQFMDVFNRNGACTHFGLENRSGPQDIPYLKKAGIRAIRDGTDWHKLQKDKLTFDWWRHQWWVDLLEENDISLLSGVSSNNPIFSGIDNVKVGPSSQYEIDAYANYAHELVKQFPYLRNYELWNEPNIPSFWVNQPGDLDYSAMSKAASVAMREADDTIDIGAFSTANIDPEFIDNCLAYGMYPYIDTITHHPYIFPTLPDKNDTYNTQIRQIEDLNIKYGGWLIKTISEIGWPTYNGTQGVDEQTSAESLIKQFAMADAQGTRGNYIYDFRNDGKDPQDREHNFGLVTEDFGFKPGFVAVRQFNQNTAGALYLGSASLGMGDGVYGYVYLKDAKPVMVSWSAPQNGEKTLSLPSEHFAAEDLYGNRITEGSEITLNEAPVYLKNLSADWAVKTVKDTASDMSRSYLAAYGEKLSDKEAFSRWESVLDDGMPEAQELDRVIGEQFALGDAILESGKAEKISELETSQMLYELHNYINVFNTLSVMTGGADGAQIASDAALAAAEQTADTLYQNEKRQKVYSEKILKTARQFNRDAHTVAGLEENPAKAGVVRAYDRMAAGLCSWFMEFSAFERTFDSGLLLYVSTKECTPFVKENKTFHPTITNHQTQAFTGKVQLLDPNGSVAGVSGEFTVAPGEQAETTVTAMIDKPEKGSVARYCFCLVASGGETILDQKTDFTVNDRVEIAMQPVESAPAETKTIGVRVKNLANQTLSVRLDMSASAGLSLGRTTVSAELAGMEEKTIEVPVASITPNDFNFYAVGYKAYDSSGALIAEASVPVSFTSITHAAEPIDVQTFDGDISGWADAYPIYINAPKEPENPASWANSDISARVFLKWAEDGMYVLTDVYDDIMNQMYTGEEMWRGDGLQVSFDTANNKSKGAYDEDDFEYGFGLTGNGNESYSWQNPEGIGQKSSDWVSIVRNDEMHITRYLMKIPTSDMTTLIPQEGKAIGFNLVINDADVLTRDEFVEIVPGTGLRKDPSLYYNFTMRGAQTAGERQTGKAAEIFPVKLENTYVAKVSPFTDIKGHWAEPDIVGLYTRGVANGVSQTQYQPEGNVTRAEFLALAMRAAELPESPYQGEGIPADVWYNGIIGGAEAAGLLAPLLAAEPDIAPEAAISRQEAAGVLAEICRKKLGSKEDREQLGKFADADFVAPWAKEDMNLCVGLGLLSGDESAMLHPEAEITRAEAAAIVMRMLKLIFN